MPFTVVFDGDVKDLEGNPHRYQTPFGDPVAISVGDLVQEVDRLENLLVDTKNERDIWRERAMSK